MDLKRLKREVYQANIELVNKGLVVHTWGNVSGIDRVQNLVVIKPSGVNYDVMTPDDMVVVDLLSGNVVEGQLRPSSDTPTHLELYRAYEQIGGVTHTHSKCAVAFAQAGRAIPALGTTHADYFYGDILCSRSLTEAEVNSGYEMNTGKVIVETLDNAETRVTSMPGVLVRNHGPFSWGKNPAESVFHAVVMEVVADMALKTLSLDVDSIFPDYILEKHYQRKHGKNAYYGQK